MIKQQHRLTAAVLLICLASRTSADSAAPLYFLDQCGGKGGNCQQYTCADAAFPEQTCAAGLTCQRHNEWFYQCMPAQTIERASSQHQGHHAQSAVAPGTTNTVAVFGQCGGRGGDCGLKKQCVDSMYPFDTCPKGTACIRHSEWYWQCVPSTRETASKGQVPGTTQPVSVSSRARLAGNATGDDAKSYAAVTSGVAAGNIKGSILVLDVGSFTKQSSSQLPIPSADQCALYCQTTRGCTGWSYCNSVDGCGSGCQEYLTKSPAYDLGSFYNAVSNPEMYVADSIKSFGPFGRTSGCAGGTSDKWPLGMCSLKVSHSAADIVRASAEEGKGWISGWFGVPNECAGLSISTCQRCLASNHPDECFTCARSGSKKTSLIEHVIGGPMLVTAVNGCV